MLSFYTAHQGELIYYTNSIVGDIGRAEDIAQEALVWLRHLNGVINSIGYLHESLEIWHWIVAFLIVVTRGNFLGTPAMSVSAWVSFAVNLLCIDDS